MDFHWLPGGFFLGIWQAAPRFFSRVFLVIWRAVRGADAGLTYSWNKILLIAASLTYSWNKVLLIAARLRYPFIDHPTQWRAIVRASLLSAPRELPSPSPSVLPLGAELADAAEVSLEAAGVSAVDCPVHCYLCAVTKKNMCKKVCVSTTIFQMLLCKKRYSSRILALRHCQGSKTTRRQNRDWRNP